MRINLKVLRIRNRLTQYEFAYKCGVSRATYSRIEKGKINGKPTFWEKLQIEFNVSDCDMYVLMKNEVQNEK